MRPDGRLRMLSPGLIGIAATALALASASAQEPMVLNGPASCNSCSIQATEVLTLRDLDRPIVGQPSGFVRRSDGSWLLAHSDDASRVMVFNPSGTFLRAIGRKGRGPGEFTTASRMTVGPADSIRILDWITGRWSVFDPELDFVRSFASPRMDVQNAAITRDGTLVVAGHLSSSDRAGLPLHLVHADGELVRSFGSTRPSFRRDRQEDVKRFVALESDSAVWSVDINRYRLQLWSLTGRLLKEIRRDVEWFEPWSEPTPRQQLGEIPPVARTMGIRRDSSGLLWVLVRVASPEWKEAVGTIRDPYGRPTLGVVDDSQYYDTVIEVIDPEVGEVVATSRVSGWLRLFTPDGYAPEYLEDEIGVPGLRIWRLELTRR